MNVWQSRGGVLRWSARGSGSTRPWRSSSCLCRWSSWKRRLSASLRPAHPSWPPTAYRTPESKRKQMQWSYLCIWANFKCVIRKYSNIWVWWLVVMVNSSVGPLEGAQGSLIKPNRSLRALPARLSVHPHLYLLPGRTAVGQGDAFVDEALVGALVLVEDLLHRQAALEHLHLFLLLQRHLQPLLSSQDLLLQRRLQFLQRQSGAISLQLRES